MIAFLRLVPSWVWVAILLVGAGAWYGQTRYNAGQADVQADWDAAVERGKAELAKIEREYRAQEHRHAADMARIGREHQEALSDAQRDADKLVADLRAGTVQLQQRWRGCEASRVPGIGGTSGEPDAASDDRSESAGRIVRAAAECDFQVRGLQSVILSDREAK